MSGRVFGAMNGYINLLEDDPVSSQGASIPQPPFASTRDCISDKSSSEVTIERESQLGCLLPSLWIETAYTSCGRPSLRRELSAICKSMSSFIARSKDLQSGYQTPSFYCGHVVTMDDFSLCDVRYPISEVQHLLYSMQCTTSDIRCRTFGVNSFA